MGEFGRGQYGTNVVGDVGQNLHEEASNLEPKFNIASSGQTRVGEDGTKLVQDAMEYAQEDVSNYSMHIEIIELDCAISASANGASGPMLLTLAAKFAGKPSLGMEHFFIAADPTDEIVVEEIAVVDPDVENLESITKFLTLPPAAPCAMSRG